MVAKPFVCVQHFARRKEYSAWPVNGDQPVLKVSWKLPWGMNIVVLYMCKVLAPRVVCTEKGVDEVWGGARSMGM